MLALILTGIEAAINSYLRLDPETIQRLAHLRNKIIKIEIVDWNLIFFALPMQDGVQLSGDFHQKFDAAIKGNLLDLMRVAHAKGSGKSLFGNTIIFEGDVHIAQSFQHILQKIDIDWEEHLSNLVGDVLAHKMTYHFNKALTFGRQTATTLRENIKEYIQEEINLFPSVLQIEEFYEDIHRLRNDVDRLEAKIKRLGS